LFGVTLQCQMRFAGGTASPRTMPSSPIVTEHASPY
jgi:hypothetical protein